MDSQELCIKDTGIGIKNSDVLRVFERGFSGYNGRLTQQSFLFCQGALSNPSIQKDLKKICRRDLLLITINLK